MNGTTITAVKAVYDRKAKGYKVEVVREADVMMCHHGYLVFDNAAAVLERVRDAKMMSHLNDKARIAVVEFLVAETYR